MNNIVHLHNHTVYSKLDGAISANLLFPRLKELGMTSFAKTDHGTLAGLFDFAKVAEKNNVKLIAGCEFYEVNTITEKFIDGGDDCREVVKREDSPDQRPDEGKQRYWHVTMLAKNREGYDQLVKLTSAANTRDAYFYKPRIDQNMLRQIIKPGNIFLGTGCAISRMAKTAMASDKMSDLDRDLDFYHSIFGGDNIFVELMATGYAPQKEINQKLIQLAEKRGLRLVVTNDAHYVAKIHARLQDILVCISTNQYVDGERKFKFDDDNYYIKSDDELRQAFKELQGIDIKDEWILNTRIIADQCEHCGYAKSPEFRLPKFNIRREKLFGEFQEWINQNQNVLMEQTGISKDDIKEVLDMKGSV